MADMVVAVPAHLERIEREGRFLRRNSTGSLGIPIAKSKVLSRYLSDPKGSCHDVCKGTERDLQTSKARTSLLSRTVAASEKIPELVATVQVQIRKKPLRSSKLPGGSSIAWDSPLDGATSTPNKGRRMDKNTGSSKLGNKKAVGKPANFRRLKTTHGEHMQARTKKLAVSACHQNDSKLKPLEENAYYVSRSNKPSRRRYSDSLITGGLPTLQGSILDDAITKTNTRSRMDKDIASYESSKKTDVGMPANLDKIESGIGYLRRNSTGSLGIEMGKSKVLSCSLSVPTCSCQEVCKCKVESDLKTKAGTLQPTRRVTASGEIPEMATTVKMHKGKKPSPTTFRAQAQKNPASTKIAVKRGSSRLSKKKDAISISNSTRTSVKRASGEKLTNNSMRMVSQRNKKISLPSKTGKVIHEDYPNKGSLIDNLTRLARTKKVQSSHENFPNKAPQLRELASLKRGKAEPGSYGGVPKGALYIRESKTKSQTRKITSENQNPRVSSLDRHGPIRGKRSSPLLSPSSSQYSDGSSSRNIGNRKSSLSSTSASESVNGDAIVSSSKKSGTATPNQYIKAGRAAIGSPKNLKFRKGKIIDFQSEKLSPRRLKFRPAKILENNGNEISHVRGRSSRRLIAYGKSNSAKDETMKVNLRHQSRGDKKEAPILFNNVIEETATKLEETRRSKVKALVGAFETVISLQDPTSSPPILIWR